MVWRGLLLIALALLMADASFSSIAPRAVGFVSTDATDLVYAQGTSLMRNGTALQLFGLNDDMAFIYTYWGGNDLGHNYNFPDFDGTIPNVGSADAFWAAYFQYYLHYQLVGNPQPNLFRVTVGWDFGSEDSYYAWKNDPTGYFADFDAMVTWAKAAGVYLCPMLWQGPTNRAYVNEYFDTASTRYATASSIPTTCRQSPMRPTSMSSRATCGHWAPPCTPVSRADLPLPARTRWRCCRRCSPPTRRRRRTPGH